MAQAAGQHDPYAALRIPAFRRLLVGWQVVAVGAASQSLAIQWEMYVRTNDPMAIGLVGLVQAIPMFLLTLPAGYLADIFDRRKLMIMSMSGRIATSVSLAAFSYLHGATWVMYLLLFVDSCFMRLGWPANAALLPVLVPRESFENAIKWRTSLNQISAMLGPAIGGFIIAFSKPAAYLASASATVLLIGLLLSISIPKTERAVAGRMLSMVGEGIRFVWNKKVLLGAISLDMFGVLLGGATYLLPVYARDILSPVGGRSPEETLGYLRAAPAAGAMLMAMILTHTPPFRRAGSTMLLAVAAFGAATILFGLSESFWISMVALAATGAMDNISVVVRHTMVQLGTPNEMRGRVSAVNAMFISSSNELGGFESGAVAHFFGPVFSVVAGGIGTIAVVLAWTGLFPSLRKVDRLADQK